MRNGVAGALADHKRRKTRGKLNLKKGDGLHVSGAKIELAEAVGEHVFVPKKWGTAMAVACGKPRARDPQ